MESSDHKKKDQSDHEGMDHSKHEGMNHSKQEEMDHSKHQGMDHSGGSTHSDHHAMMELDFKRRFFVSLLITGPILILSPTIQDWVQFHCTSIPWIRLYSICVSHNYRDLWWLAVL